MIMFYVLLSICGYSMGSINTMNGHMEVEFVMAMGMKWSVPVDMAKVRFSVMRTVWELEVI